MKYLQSKISPIPGTEPQCRILHIFSPQVCLPVPSYGLLDVVDFSGSDRIPSKRRLVKKVVAGASEYQSAWILDSDEEEDEEDIDSEEDMAPEQEEDSDEEMDEEEDENPSVAGDSVRNPIASHVYFW